MRPEATIGGFSDMVEAITPWVWCVAVIVTLVILIHIGEVIYEDGWGEFFKALGAVTCLFVLAMLVSQPIGLWIDSLK